VNLNSINLSPSELCAKLSGGLHAGGCLPNGAPTFEGRVVGNPSGISRIRLDTDMVIDR